MANLWVRGIDGTLFDTLVREAEENGRSVEDEHRVILEEALQKVYNRQFIRALMSMPNVGEDSDFERVNDRREAPVVFD
ncbi:DNA-binding protein [Paraburkholderia bryophila]|uniref:FitA-like ribbon-helix-helix domain-containing protein n=1 Tax=Paraburkholderia bryophila TaxID=420952 RepID=UPI00234BAC4A|nr:DNA-binding protein [Paraburkholderia bryophila]WCM18064.1 DNA-binding protein [Paraburkholderia bryophila]